MCSSDLCLIAAVASLLRGTRYVHELHAASPAPPTAAQGTGRAPASVTAGASATDGPA